MGRAVPSNPDEREYLHEQKGKVHLEQERHGYVAEPRAEQPQQGAIYRHPTAPTLLVREDGGLTLLSEQPGRDCQSVPRAEAPHLKRDQIVTG